MTARRNRRLATSSRGTRRPLSSLFFAIGCLVVLGVTFALGMAAGRRWPDGLPLPGLRGATATAAARAEARRPEARGLDKDKGKARAEVKPAETAKPAPRVEASKPAPSTAAAPVDTSLQDVEGTPPVAATPAATRPESRFTVQVGAFKVRAQAEALRTKLAERGQDAAVSEVEIGGTTQYRVRVGAFATREAAQEAAGRLGSEQRLSTYVTVR